MTRDGSWRRARLDAARLYVCVGLRRERSDLDRFLDAALGGGVDIVQLREKEARNAELVAAAASFRAAADEHGALFIVNDDPELAAQVGADGVHVGQEDPAPAVARSVVGADALVGRSTHGPEQFDRALAEDTDYVAIGPVHETPTKAGRPGIGLGPVRHAASVADRPWFVTGGMSAETAPEVLARGAHGIVVVRAVVDAEDPGAAARGLADLLRDR